MALGAYFYAREKPKEPVPAAARPALKEFSPGSYTVRSGLLAASANLAAYKNKIEKNLESDFGKEPFKPEDSDAVGRLALDLEKLLRDMRRGVSAADRVSQLEAAEAERRTLVLENAKLKALIGGAGASRARAGGQLAAVEESIYRLQLHLEGLAARELQ